METTDEEPTRDTHFTGRNYSGKATTERETNPGLRGVIGVTETAEGATHRERGGTPREGESNNRGADRSPP